MKKSAILWSVLLVVFSTFAIEFARWFAADPLQFKPNWLTIIPAFTVFPVLAAIKIRQELAASESRTRKAKAELAAVCAGTPLADLI